MISVIDVLRSVAHVPYHGIHPCAAPARDDASAGRSTTSNVPTRAEHIARSHRQMHGYSSYDLGRLTCAQLPPRRHRAARAARVQRRNPALTYLTYQRESSARGRPRETFSTSRKSGWYVCFFPEKKTRAGRSAAPRHAYPGHVPEPPLSCHARIFHLLWPWSESM